MDVQELKDLRDDLAKDKRSLEDVIAKVSTIHISVTNKIEDLNIFIQEAEKAERESSKPKIKPENCLHANRKVGDSPNAEVIECADCGLVLSFKHLG